MDPWTKRMLLEQRSAIPSARKIRRLAVGERTDAEKPHQWRPPRPD